MAITTMAQVTTALPGQRLSFERAITIASGAWVSPWLGGGFPAQGVTPSSGLSGDVPTAATVGALALVNAGSGALALARLHASLTGLGVTGVVMLYDRLWQNSGTNVTITTGQTVNSVALTRPDANGGQAEAWWQVYATMGTGTPQVTLAYTDQDGNTAQSAVSGVLATAMAVGRTGPFQLAAGDTGVRSIQTWTADATFTSGTIGLVIRRLLAIAPIMGGNMDALSDVLRSGLVAIPANACLELVVYGGSSAGIQVQGEALVIQG